MFILFGHSKSQIHFKKITEDIECPVCKSHNTLFVYSYGRYFHVFYIPFFPLNKFNQIQCSHCKYTCNEKELPYSLQNAVYRSNLLNPPKRPIWHGIGGLLSVGFIVFLFAITIIGAVIGIRQEPKPDDSRKELLKTDIEKTTENPEYETDSVSFFLKSCVHESVSGMKTEKIRYYTRYNGDKILVLLKVSDMKKVEKSTRKELVYAVENCLDFIVPEDTDRFIGVDGNWNMLMVKTPTASELKGDFADEELLLPFYDITQP